MKAKPDTYEKKHDGTGQLHRPEDELRQLIHQHRTQARKIRDKLGRMLDESGAFARFNRLLADAHDGAADVYQTALGQWEYAKRHGPSEAEEQEG